MTIPLSGGISWRCMRCLRCHYPLTMLAAHACPECGRPFDPDDPRTFDEPPERPRWGTSLGHGIGWGLMIGLFVMTAAYSPLDRVGLIGEVIRRAAWPADLTGSYLYLNRPDLGGLIIVVPAALHYASYAALGLILGVPLHLLRRHRYRRLLR